MFERTRTAPSNQKRGFSGDTAQSSGAVMVFLRRSSTNERQKTIRSLSEPQAQGEVGDCVARPTMSSPAGSYIVNEIGPNRSESVTDISLMHASATLGEHAL